MIGDTHANVGQLTAAVEDLGRVLLRDFALIDANDWFQIPLPYLSGRKWILRPCPPPTRSESQLPFRTTQQWTGRAAVGACSRSQLNLPTVITSAAALPYELLVTPSAVARMDAAPIEEVL